MIAGWIASRHIAAHGRGAWATLQRAATAVAVGPLVFLAACSGVQKRIEAVDKTVDFISRTVDPTGVLDVNAAFKKAGEALEAKIDALDVEGFNGAVQELHDAIRKLSERLGALSTSDVSSVSHDVAASAASVRRQLEEAHLDQVIRSYGQFAETLNRQAETLNLQHVLGESDLAIKELRAQVNKLGTNLQTAVIDIRQLVQAARETVHEVDCTLDSLKTKLGWAGAVLILFGLCALVWLVRAVRTRPSSIPANK